MIAPMGVGWPARRAGRASGVVVLALALTGVAGLSALGDDRSWQGIVTAKTLNVRAGPGDGFTVVGTLAQGDTIEAVDEKAGWIRLKDDQPAWVARAFVRLPKNFLAPEFGDQENEFLDWAAARGDLAEIAVDGADRLSLVPNEPRAKGLEALAREIGCEWRKRTGHDGAVTVTVWPPEGPGGGFIAQAVCR